MADGRGTTLSNWGRIVDYLFGRNALIAIASIMLLLISGFATWSGMNDFIVGASQSSSKGTQVSEGFSVSHHSLVVFITIALTFLMWLSLREAIGKGRSLVERLVTWPLYIFLALWSIGFGYGFWWSLIAGEEATRNSMSALQEDARTATGSISARLDAVKAQVDSFVSWSESQMQREESSGGSCGIASGAGRGPLYNARRSTRDSVGSLRETIVNSWLSPVNAELEVLKKAGAAIEGATPDERQKRFEAVSSQVRGSARAIAQRSNELGKSTASEMRALADSVSVPPGQPGFACYDPTLSQRLRQAAEQAAVPASIVLREAAFNEGPAGVANAVKNLWANLGTYMYSTVTWAFTGKTSTTTTGEPITGRDVIALLATIGIDLGLLVLALLDPPSSAPVRRDALAETQARLHQATGPVVRQIESAILTAITRAPDADIEWVRQHFIHHNGASYFVIPNLYSAKKDGEDSRKEELRALAMNQLAGVFDDLKLVRALTDKQLQQFGREEQRYSYSDLSIYQSKEARPVSAPTGIFDRVLSRGSGGAVASDEVPITAQPGKRIRNHGLLSKAQRALDIAGWTPAAQSDVEIFQLVDDEGLTPLLAVLSEATLDRSGQSPHGASTIDPVASKMAAPQPAKS